MKRLTNIVLAFFLVVVFVVPRATLAEDLTAAQLEALESTGIPTYPESSYTTGDESVATLMWFKSLDSPDEIVNWYKDKLADWSEMTVNGSRVIYRGPEGIESGELSTKAYIFARTKDESGVSEDSEITIRIPK